MKRAYESEKLAVWKKSAAARENRRKQEIDAHRTRAGKVSRRAAEILKVNFGAERVIVYGSLVRGHRFHLRSDIDLAVEAIPAADFWRAWAALDAIAEGFEINLVDLEAVSEKLRQEIEAHGVEL